MSGCEPTSEPSLIGGSLNSRSRRFPVVPKAGLAILVITLVVLVLALLPALGVIQLPGQRKGFTPVAPGRGADGPWEQVFSQDFDQAAPLGSFMGVYGSKFTDYPYPWTDTSRTLRSNPGYYNTAKTVSVENGYLDIWLHYDSQLAQYLVAALLPRLPTMRYGKFSLRMNADRTPGYKSSPLLWPDSDTFPDDGEIDIPEGSLGGKPFMAFSHYAQPASVPGPTQDVFSTGVNGADWHTYEVVWTPGRVEFLVDDQSIGASTKAVPSNPMHWVLQFETGLGTTAPPQSSQGHVRIDWVQAWQWNG